MTDIVERLRENIIADAHEVGRIVDGDLAERLIRERSEASDMIGRLRVFAESFGVCTCAEGMCDPIADFQCRAREALSGVSNISRVRSVTADKE